MLHKTTVPGSTVLAVVVCSAGLFAQQTPVAPRTLELPVTMRQNVDAGKTPVGTRVQAKLTLATLVSGTVIPRDATLSGEVTQSVAKTKTEPSRLAVRIDTAQWKNGSAPLKVYLTAWYYPTAMMIGQDLSYQSADAASSPKNWNGMGPYPEPNNPVAQQKFPGVDTGKDPGLTPPDSPSSNISKHRVLMKDVESRRNSDGVVTLTCKRSNIKLDKLTTYVLAAGDMMPTN
jgi:hypothetical protein